MTEKKKKEEKRVKQSTTPEIQNEIENTVTNPNLETSELVAPSTIEIKPIIRHRQGVIKWQ